MRRIYKRILKPLIDFCLALFFILLLPVPMLLVSLAIVIDDPGPVLFKQKRVGKSKNGKITYFNIYKFRSMKVDTPCDVATHLLESPDKYVTRVGKLLRKTSIDEFPQLINILLGQMSFVGPRPALYNQDDLVLEREKYGANNVTPGLTGWAQINGRDELSINEKARFDGEYSTNLTLLFDIKIVFKTISYVLKGKGLLKKASNEREEVLK